MRDRVIMPFSGSYADDDHVLGHELVHVFQYHVAQAAPDGVRGVQRIPLWLIEGMAEYLSLGRSDPNTAMWLRDAMRRNDLPTIDQLGTDPRYFPYRYGQALWAYIGGRWGDDAIVSVYRAALTTGWKAAIDSVLHVTPDSLSRAWHAAIRAEYADAVRRTPPDRVGRLVVSVAQPGEQNVSPSLSPDGTRIAYFSSRALFGFDVYVADASTGHVIRRLTSVTGDPHYDALSFISSAGTWSPDGRRFAFVVYADGDNRIDIVDAASGTTLRTIHPDGIGAITDPAWSPDGRRIAFTGIRGGISDLYLYDLGRGTTERLTSGREAEFQAAWSPDGRTIAFATDRGPGTNFTDLTHGPMRLALLDVASHAVRLLDTGPGKAISPAYAPDGTSLYFVSDRDGISDVYRTTLASGAVERVTSVSTGVSGITASAPALSVARSTGDIAVSVFDRGGYAIRLIPGGVPHATVARRPAGATDAGILPPAAAVAHSEVSRSLRSPDAGLPAAAPTQTRPYDASLQAAYARSVGVGVTFGGAYGSGLAGGIALGFTDMLGDRLAQVLISGQGELADVGGEVTYLSRRSRWNVGVEGHHAPFVATAAGYTPATFDPGNGQSVSGAIVTQYLQREYVDGASVFSQYPLSQTHRLELSVGGDHVSYSERVDSAYVAGNVLLGRSRTNLPAPGSLNLASASIAYVGDYSFFGATSPVAGGRYRFEVTPHVGSLSFETALADYRHYFFARPLTLAVRAMHLGRYGADADNGRLQPIFIGDPSFVRGYEASDFSPAECTPVQGAASDCPEFARLAGSRVAVAGAELRIPLLGPPALALHTSRLFPVEVAPFVDAGVAWSSASPASWRFDRNTTDRVPVVSAGVATRIGIFGAFVVEVYWAKPFQRPGRGGHFGFQLIPGW